MITQARRDKCVWIRSKLQRCCTWRGSNKERLLRVDRAQEKYVANGISKSTAIRENLIAAQKVKELLPSIFYEDDSCIGALTRTVSAPCSQPTDISQYPPTTFP